MSKIKEKPCACKQKNVNVTCPSCGMSFCDDCDEATHKIPAFTTHKRSPYLGVESSKYCTLPDHEGNLLTLYCKDCKVSICGGVCAHVEHKSHNFIPLSRAIGEIKEELAKLLGPYIKEEKDLEVEIQKKQEDLKLVRVALEEIKALLLHTDKENSFLTLVGESKLWKIQEKKLIEKRDVSWMETSDAFQGFRPMPSPPDGKTRLWACVAKIATYSSRPKYDPPVGYEWASSDMWNTGVSQTGSEYVYHSQGGWIGYTWRGVERYYFHFSDNMSFHAGNFPQSTTPQSSASGSDPFAGIFVYKSGTWDPASKRWKN